MSDRSTISWWDATWNPVIGCYPESEACEHCYAARMAIRLAANRLTPWYRDVVGENGWNGCLSDAPLRVWRQPLAWRRARRIFVGSMSDVGLWAPGQISALDTAVCASPHHTFMLLTKRPALLRAKLACIDLGGSWRNVWLGVTAENQTRADERIPELLKIPAAVRFVSCEPLLGEIVLWDNLWMREPERAKRGDHTLDLHWVIAGPETGPGARPCDPTWIASLECQAAWARVPFFDKRPGVKREFPEQAALGSTPTDDPCEYGKSGKSLPQIVREYERRDAEIDEAIRVIEAALDAAGRKP